MCTGPYRCAYRLDTPGTASERVVVTRRPIECSCVHVPDWHEHGVGTCTAPLIDSLGTEYGVCPCSKYTEAPDAKA